MSHFLKDTTKNSFFQKIFLLFFLFQFSITSAGTLNNTLDIPEEILPLWNSLTLKEKIAQMIMVYMPPEDYIITHQFGAVLIMKPHLKDTNRLKESLSKANQNLKIPLLVATDQEGGFVNRLANVDPKWNPLPSAKTMRSWSIESIDSVARITGEALASLGINLNLAPVLDPATDHRGKKTFIEESDRSWGNLDSTNVEKVRAFVTGLAKSNVFCVSKHFPGYDSWTNSDHQIAMSSAPKETIERNILPFKILVEDIPFIMMSSVRFRKISDAPAVFEKNIVTQAKALHPKTIILTDDLWGTSLRSWISKRENLKRKNYPKADFQKLILKTLQAGNDMFMITYPAKAVEMIHYLERLAKKNAKYRKQIEESALKIILMKYNSGLLKPTNF